MKPLIKNIISFFKGLTPTFERSKIISDLQGTCKEMRDSTVKTLSAMSPELGGNTKIYKELSRTLIRKGAGSSSPTEVLYELLSALITREAEYIEIIDKSFNSFIAKEALDFEKLNIIHLVNAIAFVNKYSRMYAMAMVGAERMMAGKRPKGYQKQAAEFCEDKDNIEAIGACFAALSLKPKDVFKSLEKLRGIKVFEDFNEKAVGLQVNSTDQLKLGFVPVELNLAFWIGTAYNSWKAFNYEQAKIEFEQIQLELLSLEYEATNADPSAKAKIEKQIDSYNSRLVKVAKKIEDIEDEVK